MFDQSQLEKIERTINGAIKIYSFLFNELPVTIYLIHDYSLDNDSVKRTIIEETEFANSEKFKNFIFNSMNIQRYADYFKFDCKLREISTFSISKSEMFILVKTFTDKDEFAVIPETESIEDLHYQIIHQIIHVFNDCIDSKHGYLNELEQFVFCNTKTLHIAKCAYTFKKETRKFKFEIKKFQEQFDDFSTDHNFKSISYIKEHISDAISFSEDLMEMAESIEQMSLSYLSNRTNEIMKALTIISFITMPISLHLSFFGSNFNRLPFVKSEYGWITFTFFAFIQTIIILTFLIKKQWIFNHSINLKKSLFYLKSFFK